MTLSPIQQALDERVRDWHAEPAAATCTLCFDADFPGFAGHFPGTPIVPGVCLTNLLPVLAQRLLNRPCLLQSISREKFTRAISPGETCQFRLVLAQPADGTLHADLAGSCGDTPVCKIKATLALS